MQTDHYFLIIHEKLFIHHYIIDMKISAGELVPFIYNNYNKSMGAPKCV